MTLKRLRRLPKVWTPEMIDDEGAYLVEWAKKDTSIVLAECYGKRGYSCQQSTYWDTISEYWKDCKQRAKTIVGARREIGALKGRYDAQLVRHSMAVYDPEYATFLRDMKRENILEEISAEAAAKELSAHLKSKKQVKE